MFSLLTLLIGAIFNLLKSKKELIIQIPKRPHQGIDQRIPNGYKAQTYGRVLKFPILGGLCHHYVRRAA
jgi:hypothetical protein